MVDKRIRIILDSRGARREADGLNNSIQGVGKTADSAQFKVNKLALAITAVVTSAALRSIATMVQDYQAMSERVQMATKSTEEFNMVQRRLNETANGTFRSLSEAQELYLRTSSALQSLGYDTSQTLDVIDSISYAFVVNATSADRANSAIEAFGKSVSKGRVDADNWETILSAIPTIIDDIAEASGKSSAEIRALGASGKLSLTDLTEGFRLAREENKNLADGMSVNLVDASVRTKNALTNLFVALEEQYGVIDFVTKSIVDAAESLNDFVGDSERFEAAMSTVGDVVEVVSVLIAARLTASVVTSTAAFVAQQAAMLRGTVTMNAMGVVIGRTTVATNLMAVAARGASGALALLGGPVGALIVAASALVYFATKSEDAAKSTDLFTTSVENLTRAQASLERIKIENALEQTRRELEDSAREIDNMTMRWSELGTGMNSNKRRQKELGEQIKLARAEFDVTTESIQKYEDRLKSLDDVIAGRAGKKDPIIKDPTLVVTGAEPDSGTRQIASAQAVTRSLQEELNLRRTVAQIYRDNELAQDASLYEQQLAIVRTREAEALAIAQSRATEEAAQREERLAATLENEKLTQEARAALKIEFDQQEILAAQILEQEKTAILQEGVNARIELERAERDARLANAGALGNALINLGQGQNKKIFKIGQKLALAQAAVALPTAVLESFKNGGGYPWGLVPAATMLATGLKNIQQIKSAGSGLGGGGGGSVPTPSLGGGGSGSGPQIPSTANSQELVQQRRIIDLRGVKADDKLSVAAWAKLMEEDNAIVILENARDNAARRNVIGVSAR